MMQEDYGQNEVTCSECGKGLGYICLDDGWVGFVMTCSECFKKLPTSKPGVAS